MRFLIIGSGYRAGFFIRAALASCPDKLIGVLTRSEDTKQKIQDEYNIKAFTSREEALKEKPDFVIVCSNKSVAHKITTDYLRDGIPVLKETPSGLTLEELNELYALSKSGAKLQIAEQYIFCPHHKKVLEALDSLDLGKRHTIFFSEAHDYHGMSLIRHYLKKGITPYRIRGFGYSGKTTVTDSRYGLIFTGELKDEERSHLIIEWQDGTHAFYDFSPIQYHSTIRDKSIRLLTTRGQYCTGHITYLDAANHQQSLFIPPITDQNEEDEEAIKILLSKMETFVQTGQEFYPLAEALEDSYAMLLMQEAIKKPFAEVRREERVGHWFI